MRRLLLLAATLLVFGNAAIYAGDIREFDLKTTERLGNELVRLSHSADRGFTTAAKKRAKETAITALRGKLFEEVRYDYVILDDPAGSGFLVYALAIAKNKGDIFTGGHYRVLVSADGAGAKRVDLLSQLIKQSKLPGGATLAAIGATQLHAKRPVETWIYSSDLYGIPMYVGVTDGSLWGIANGRIVRVDEKGPKNHLDIMNKKAPEVPQ
jgi:hypothetical protein